MMPSKQIIQIISILVVTEPRGVLNPDTTAAKTLQGPGWANINILEGNVIFFSKKPAREAAVQPITLTAPFHLWQGL